MAYNNNETNVQTVSKMEAALRREFGRGFDVQVWDNASSKVVRDAGMFQVTEVGLRRAYMDGMSAKENGWY